MKTNSTTTRKVTSSNRNVRDSVPSQFQLSGPRVLKKTTKARKGSKAQRDQSGDPLLERAKVSIIRANIDVGFGNALFIRGSGGGLNWEHGKPLECLDAATWVWTCNELTEPIDFKLLLNDSFWAVGEILTLAPGEEVNFTPTFP